MSRHRVLRHAEFSPRLKDYYLLSGTVVLACTIIGLPIAIAYFIAGRALVQRWIDRLGCTLTDRTLEIRKGILTRTESTLPLDKITDLQMVQGPIMRAMGLHGFRVETAGQSAGPGQSLVSLIGIVDAHGFREAVLDQRDRMHDRAPAPEAPRDPAGAALPADGAVLGDIRDTLHRIEGLLAAGARQGAGEAPSGL